MSEKTLRLPNGTAVQVRSEDATIDGTSTGTWLAEQLCHAAPDRPDLVKVVFGSPGADGVAPVTVTLGWDRAPERPANVPARQVADDPPGLVLPTQRPGAAPSGLN